MLDEIARVDNPLRDPGTEFSEIAISIEIQTETEIQIEMETQIRIQIEIEVQSEIQIGVQIENGVLWSAADNEDEGKAPPPSVLAPQHI
jgi:bifunctional N-acetylglucosamine-1-phosphate-uridyltransferase/glucosamine-1-phosphate-acetyltransferase GlmU-like protein